MTRPKRCRPDVAFHCLIKEDPFVYMEDSEKVYGQGSLSFRTPHLTLCQGFTIAVRDIEQTVRTLWTHVKGSAQSLRLELGAQLPLEFMNLHPEHISQRNSMYFLSQDQGKTYSTCHCKCSFPG